MRLVSDEARPIERITFAGDGLGVHYQDLGVVAAPLLLASMATGALMVFPALGGGLIAGVRPHVPKLAEHRAAPAHHDLVPLFRAAAATFPNAEFRCLQWPRKTGAPIVLRLRQPFEWTPNGRTFVYADLLWKLAMSVSGGALMLLGSLAVYAFWRIRWNIRSAVRNKLKGRRSGARHLSDQAVSVGSRPTQAVPIGGRRRPLGLEAAIGGPIAPPAVAPRPRAFALD